MSHHIVLDIDGTLMDSSTNKIEGVKPHFGVMNDETIYYFYKRPYLDEFIEFCFEEFDSVSLWTAGDKFWLDNFTKNIIKKKYSDKFLFTYHRDRCTSRNYSEGCYKSVYDQVVVTKKMKKIWKTKKAKLNGITKDNLLIVDDTPQTYIENYGNAILIDTFDYGDTSSDKELYKLKLFLINLKKEKKSFRKIDKRNWSEKK